MKNHKIERKKVGCCSHTCSHINSDGSSIYPTTINDHECVLIFIDVSSSNSLSQLKISRTLPTACLIIFSICDQQSFEKNQIFSRFN